MPIVRLEFDLDGEVYPELHAALSALASPQARAERLRQLAASGLVWEKVRLHGASAGVVTTDDSVAPPEPASSAPAPRARRSSPARKAPPAAASPSLASAAPQPVRAAARSSPRQAAQAEPEAALGSGFVDLALDAEPGAFVDPTLGDAAEVAQIVRELPVLMDVVAEPEVPEADLPRWARPDRALASSSDETDHADLDEIGFEDDDFAATIRPPEAPVGDRDTDATLGEVHVTALAHKPATRSRLMRMKDRGLFKNG